MSTFQRTPQQIVLEKLAKDARDTITKMHAVHQRGNDMFWRGRVSPESLLEELGTQATAFMTEAYTFAEVINALDASYFPRGRNEAGYLLDALPPRELVYHEDGTVTLVPLPEPEPEPEPEPDPGEV